MDKGARRVYPQGEAQDVPETVISSFIKRRKGEPLKTKKKAGRSLARCKHL